MIRSVRKPATSYMSADEFRACCDAVGLSINTTGKWLRISRRTAERYARGYSPITFAVAELLRVYLRLGLKPDILHVPKPGAPKCDQAPIMDSIRRTILTTGAAATAMAATPRVFAQQTGQGGAAMSFYEKGPVRIHYESEVLMNSKPRKATRGTSLPSGPAFAPPPAMMARKIPNAAFMAEGLLLAAPPEGYRLEVRLPSMPQADTQFQRSNRLTCASSIAVTSTRVAVEKNRVVLRMISGSAETPSDWMVRLRIRLQISRFRSSGPRLLAGAKRARKLAMICFAPRSPFAPSLLFDGRLFPPQHRSLLC